LTWIDPSVDALVSASSENSIDTSYLEFVGDFIVV
jgi:hypothetical protein